MRSYRKQEASLQEGVTPLLRIENASAGYGRGPLIVKNINLDIHRKRTVAVVGESGSGKSTLARVATGLLPAREGKIYYDGELWSNHLNKRSKDQLRRMQMIYQQFLSRLCAKTVSQQRHNRLDHVQVKCQCNAIIGSGTSLAIRIVTRSVSEDRTHYLACASGYDACAQHP